MKKSLLFSFLLFFFTAISFAQITITPNGTAQALAERLVGTGVTISNVSFTGNVAMAGFFKNIGNTNINLDSGIVLTTGRAATSGSSYGVNGNGATQASSVLADMGWGLPGDAQLAATINTPVSQLSDACVLEFDFKPLGDTVRFRYVFSSEEYDQDYVCTYNDAFAFFISGPGITGTPNIALVPLTTTPVSIFNVNNVPPFECPNNTGYYINNTTNKYFTHDGHTTVFTAVSRVQPCQTYHLKMVISDVVDDLYDSGVFLEARSLSSNAYTLQNITQFDPSNNNSYLVEGCVPGSVKISRALVTAQPETVFLGYGGTAINGVDVQLLPPSIIIPAGQTDAILNIIPIIDGLAEGIEVLNIYTLAPCSAGAPVRTDSTKLEIRDYDILGIIPDSVFLCRNGSQQLQATNTWTTYAWDPNPALSSTTVYNPIATPTAAATTYYCTATIGNCQARDSAFLKWKDLEFLSKTDILCTAGSNGQIKIAAGPEWLAPLQFQIGTGPFQADSTFNNLPVGNYYIKVQDASGCLDSIPVSLVQSFPDLLFTPAVTNGSCAGTVADGSITLNANGGKTPYEYQLNSGTFQSTNNFSVPAGSYSVTVRDANNCTKTSTVVVGFDNNLAITPGAGQTICEGSSASLSVTGTADSYAWFPAATLTNSNTTSPTATPITTTKYYVRGTKGICNILDSVMVFVNPAPIPNAGKDTSVCFGGSVVMNGASGGTIYQWTPSTYLDNSTIQSPTVTRPLNDITYTLSVSDANGCNSLVTDDIFVKVTPAVRIFAGKDTIVAISQPVQLQAAETNASGVTNWVWAPVTGLNNPRIANPVATLTDDITYVVTGSTPENCEGSDTLKIKVYKGPRLYVPSAFTPNADGRNDLLRVISVGMKTTKYFTVYNRYGQAIFTTADFRKGWDGRYKGQAQPAGGYVWIAEAVDYKNNVVKEHGTFIMIR